MCAKHIRIQKFMEKLEGKFIFVQKTLKSMHTFLLVCSFH